MFIAKLGRVRREIAVLWLKNDGCCLKIESEAIHRQTRNAHARAANTLAPLSRLRGRGWGNGSRRCSWLPPP
jgi:hypothetical protein